jgi:hypothetical protein
MDPNQVRFSQDSVSYWLSEGQTIDDLAEGLRTGQVHVEDIPPLRLVEIGGLLYTLDNRRLEAFRRAGIAIPWRMATPEEADREKWKFTTANEGISARIRGEEQ